MARTKKTDIVVAPRFAPYGAKIVKGYQAFDKASVRLKDTIEGTMRLYVDAIKLAGMPQNTPEERGAEIFDKDRETCGAIRKAIAIACDEGTGSLATAIATGTMERKTLIEYGLGVQRAWFHGLDWEAGLKNDPDTALPWSVKAKAAQAAQAAQETAKAGAVSTTTAEELQKTLLKAIEQARLLNMRDFANELGSFVGNYLDAFKFESKSE